MAFDKHLFYDKNLDSKRIQDLIKEFKASPHIFGIALYGTIPEKSNLISDYDIVIVQNKSNLSINKILTSIDERISDVVFIHLEDLKNALTSPLPVTEKSKAGFVFKKIEGAHIVYDQHQLLQELKTKLENNPNWLHYDLESLYNDWYWLNHQLYHIRRMSKSDADDYQLSVQLKICKNIGSIYQSYFKVRHQPWRGEKFALGYWDENDKPFHDLLRAFLWEQSAKARVEIYEKLIEIALQPVGGLWSSKVTAIILDGHDQQTSNIQSAYEMWLSMRGYHQPDTTSNIEE